MPRPPVAVVKFCKAHGRGNATCLPARPAVNLSSPRVTLALSCLVVAAACRAPEPFREGVRLADRLYPGDPDPADGFLITRLVDDFTGAPVVGAEMFLVDESNTPIAGEFWYSSRAVSDAEGFVRIDLPPGARGFGWQVVRHPAHGVASRSGPEAIWRLGRGFDVPVRITDWLGRPAAGARIGFCGGCGHSPDLVNAVADAGGLAVLRGIDPKNGIADLYVQHPGLHFFYDCVDWLPGEGPMLVQCAYAPAMTGTVIDHLGKPVAGAYVCGGAKHRGPWARTAADGTFAILGAEPPASPFEVVTARGRKVVFDDSEAWPVTLRLPDPAEAKTFEGAVENEPPRQFVAMRDVPIEIVGAPGPVEFEVRFAGNAGPADTELPAAEHVRIPVRGPFVLHCWTGDGHDRRVRRLPFVDGAEGSERLVVTWPPDATVRLRVVDPAGQPRHARVRLRDRWSDASGSVGTGFHEAPEGVVAFPARAGRWLLEVEDGERTLRPRLFAIAVPEPGAKACLDLGAVTLSAAPSLRAVDDEGHPLRAGLAAWARPGWQAAGEPREWPLDATGQWRGPDLRAGDMVVVQRDAAAVPFRTVLQGDGPWTITVPSGRLSLQVTDPEGTAIDAVVVVGDEERDVVDGASTLAGLPNGPLRLFVSAKGRRSAIVDAVVNSQPQTVRVALPAR